MKHELVETNDSISQAEPVEKVPAASPEYRVAGRIKVLLKEATVIAERASKRVKSLAIQKTTLAQQGALLELTHDSIIIRDAQDRITFWNRRATETYGYTAKQALGRVTHELLQTEFLSPLGEIQGLLLAKGCWEGELVHTRADNTKITVCSRWALQRDSEGRTLRVLEINTEITERKLAEDACRQSEERLALLIRGGKGYAIYMLDPEGRVAIWNEGAERLTGYDATEIIGREFAILYTPAEIAIGRPEEVLQTAKEQGSCEDEGWRVRKDGTRFWGSVIVTALRDKDGELKGFGKVTRDYSERKLAALLLEETRKEQLRFKDEFLSHVSHELRSPLAAIDSFCSIIADGLAGETTTEQDEYLGIIAKNAVQLQSMVEDLLEVTRCGSGQLRIDLAQTSLSPALLDAFNTLKGAAAAKEVDFTLRYDPGLPEVKVDSTRVLQTLIILCDNAIKFTPSGGKVKVEAGIFEKDPRFLVVSVSDTGCGIGPEALERIFEDHFQESEPGVLGRRGLGLGLHIAKSLINRQGGEIWVTSEANHGSTFTFTLPVFWAKGTGPVTRSAA